MYAVEMTQIVKKFGNFTANDHVDLMVKRGEIHSLLGENGAGKTTLMNVLYGLYGPESGTMKINGTPVEFTSPLDAISHGISMVHQHFMLVDSLTVVENIVLGNEPKRGIRFDFEKACKEVAEIADAYGLKVNPREMVGNLSVGLKQRVEILKALYHRSDILILDEPTAVLTPQEVDGLFHTLFQLKEQGKTIIIITHKLKETIRIADTLTILRKGKLILSRAVAGADEKELAELMVGRLVSFDVDRRELEKQGEPVLSLNHITLKKQDKRTLDDISLNLYPGEILGIAGVEGNGQTELIEVVTGLTKVTGGEICYQGELLTQKKAADFLRAGIAHIPEDRNLRGGAAEFTVWENYILGYHSLEENKKREFLRTKEIIQRAKNVIEEYQIHCDSVDNTLHELSGGNQQKLIVARALSHNPKVIIAAQPTRGVDIGAIEYIHNQLVEFRNRGNAILLISADLDEVVKLSDRIAVLYEGKIVAIKNTSDYTEQQLGNYMLGNDVEEQP